MGPINCLAIDILQNILFCARSKVCVFFFFSDKEPFKNLKNLFPPQITFCILKTFH